MLNFTEARRNLVNGQLRTCDVTDHAVLAAFEEIPREIFVPLGQENLAYLDRETGLGRDPATGEERAYLQPMVLAKMIQALHVSPGSKVLDIGCGLGYSTAILAKMGAHVTAVENSAPLAEGARNRLMQAGIVNAQVLNASLSAPEGVMGPFDAIIVNGTIMREPEALIDRLAADGRLVAIMGKKRTGKAVLFTKSPSGHSQRPLFDASGPILADFRAAPEFAF